MSNSPFAEGGEGSQKFWLCPEFWAVVLLLGMQVSLIWSVPEIPTADGPAHKYSAWVYRHLQHDNAPELARNFTMREGWVFPNAAYPLFLISASHWLTLDQAEKLAGTVYILALAIAFRLFFVSLGGRGWTSQILLLTLTLNLLFFMGFLSFLWGVVLVLISMALTNRLLKQPSLVVAVLANLTLLFTYWSHLLSFCVGLISVAVLTMARGRRRIVAGCAGWLPAAVIVALLSHSFAPTLSDWQYQDAFWERVWRVVSMRIATSFGGAEVAWAAICGLLVLAVAILAAWRTPNRGGLLALTSLSLVMLVLALIVPRGAGSGFFIDDRVAFFFWVLVVALAGFSAPRLSRLVAVVAVLFCLVQIGNLVRVFGQFEEERASFVTGTEQIPSGAEVFAYSFLGEPSPGVVRPFANPNARLALLTESPNYYHYQADRRHCSQFLVCYTDEGASRYVGEHTFAGIHPSNLVGFVDSVMVWGVNARVESELQNLYRYRRVYENDHLTIYSSSEPPLEQELSELTRSPDPSRRLELAERIVEARGVDRRVLQADRVVLANAWHDGWTRGTRPAALVISNPDSEPWTPVLKFRGPPGKRNQPATMFVEDGERTESFAFTSRAQKITLSPVAPGSKRLFTVWADRGWYLEKGYAPRCLGVQLTKVLE